MRASSHSQHFQVSGWLCCSTTASFIPLIVCYYSGSDCRLIVRFFFFFFKQGTCFRGKPCLTLYMNTETNINDCVGGYCCYKSDKRQQTMTIFHVPHRTTVNWDSDTWCPELSRKTSITNYSPCVYQYSPCDCLTRASLTSCDMTGKWLYCPVYIQPIWWDSVCVWVCLFSRPYLQLLCLPRPGLCWLSSSSSSLSGQISAWSSCSQRRKTLRHFLLHEARDLHSHTGSMSLYEWFSMTVSILDKQWNKGEPANLKHITG